MLFKNILMISNQSGPCKSLCINKISFQCSRAKKCSELLWLSGVRRQKHSILVISSWANYTKGDKGRFKCLCSQGFNKTWLWEYLLLNYLGVSQFGRSDLNYNLSHIRNYVKDIHNKQRSFKVKKCTFFGVFF